jgi:hypothetical protein
LGGSWFYQTKHRIASQGQIAARNRYGRISLSCAKKNPNARKALSISADRSKTETVSQEVPNE